MSVESKERRKALQLFGATSLFALAGGASSQQLCRNGGESTAGPYPDAAICAAIPPARSPSPVRR